MLDGISCIITTGGFDTRPSIIIDEVSNRHLKAKKFPNLPTRIYGSTMSMHNKSIIVCGGLNNEKKCLLLTHGTWKEHSTLNEERIDHSAVTTQTATFLFGGTNTGGTRSRTTYEYLPKGSAKWLMGKTEIPGGFLHGCAIVVKSDNEIWLIGGIWTGKRILSFNVNDHTFQVLSLQLNIGRSAPRCAFIPTTNKIMVTGGKNSGIYLDSTEILDCEDGSVTLASPMMFKRVGHGMGVITINGEDRLAAFGGRGWFSDCGRSVEVYSPQLECWSTKNIKMKETKADFGFLCLKLSDVIGAHGKQGSRRQNSSKDSKIFKRNTTLHASANRSSK